MIIWYKKVKPNKLIQHKVINTIAEKGNRAFFRWWW